MVGGTKRRVYSQDVQATRGATARAAARMAGSQVPAHAQCTATLPVPNQTHVHSLLHVCYASCASCVQAALALAPALLVRMMDVRAAAAAVKAGAAATVVVVAAREGRRG